MSIHTGGELERRLIALMDGTRTRADLYSELAPLLVTDKSEAELMAELDTSLKTLAQLGIFLPN
jgi:hypothetical protein